MGQRQHISFARALLAAPIILLLDEATANIDSHSERLLQEGLRELLKGRTTVVTAHRLSAIRDSDLIALLDRGRIRKAGRHELWLRSGYRQAGGDLTDPGSILTSLLIFILHTIFFQFMVQYRRNNCIPF